MLQSSRTEELTRFERAAIALGRFTNERAIPKRLQLGFLNEVSHRWVTGSLRPRMYVEGLPDLLARHYDRGIMFASNHRSFFDMYAVMSPLFSTKPSWMQRIYFPVRSNFFYESPLGVLVNFAVGGGSMYPPIFRDPAKAAFTLDALERIKRFLAEPGSIVGVHPEGTRGKGPDPYEMLPAQPGIGQMILQGKPIVIPIFINGLSNAFLSDLTARFRPNARREHPIIIMFGEPFDYADLAEKKPRAALYKLTSDRLRATILALGEQERGIRARIAAGALDDGPGWLTALVPRLKG